MNIARQQGVGFTLWKLLCLAGFLFLVVIEAEASRVMAPYNKCIANLKIIDGAVQQWALDTQHGRTDAYSLTDPKVQAYCPSHQLPVCPRGGIYLAGTNVSDAPTCSLHGTIETARKRDEALVMAETGKRLVWPVVSVVLGLFLLSPVSRIPEKIRHVLPVPLSIAYTIGFAPYYFVLLVAGGGGSVGDIRSLLPMTWILGGVVLCAAGLRSPHRDVRLFQILALGYHGVFLVSAIMHHTFRAL
jgi:hypothetical protein